MDELCLLEMVGGRRGKLVVELQVLVEEAKCGAGRLGVLPHPQSLGEQSAEVAGKREQAFEAQMGSGLGGWVDVSRVTFSDV